jgi:uncharacterized protein (TIGR02391 family)
MERIQAFTSQQLTAICKVLGDTDAGLTGTEIGQLLADCRIPDTDPTLTKWKRLYNAFSSWQNSKQLGNCVLMFVARAMNPTLYTRHGEVFASRRDELNIVLAFSGMCIGDDGKIRRSTKAENLSEARKRASRLHDALTSRSVHADVLRFCKAELLEENYFHAVFEAMKSIAAKIRAMSGLQSDGADLVQQAFGQSQSAPVLAINPLVTETEKGEQRGFANLLIGLFGTIRNPLAHNAKVEWEMSEQDALDILTTVSLIHRKLDKATALFKNSQPGRP